LLPEHSHSQPPALHFDIVQLQFLATRVFMVFCPMGGVQPAALYRFWHFADMLTTARDVTYREQIERQ
jgi:hypothetical protein